MNLALPTKPGLHLHVNLLIPSVQTPLFLHGFEAHSFLLVPHTFPVNPGAHWQRNLPYGTLENLRLSLQVPPF